MKTMQKTREKTRKLVVAGMLSAVTMVLGLTPLGIIPIGPLNATILHVPVIIGAVLEGPVVGFVIGLIFGLFSLYRAAVGGSVLAPLFLNPVVTILPRVLIGPVAYYVFRGISHLTRKRALSVGAAAVAGTLTNTIGVMGLILFVRAAIRGPDGHQPPGRGPGDSVGLGGQRHPGVHPCGGGDRGRGAGRLEADRLRTA